jgi:hypothetical protein
MPWCPSSLPYTDFRLTSIKAKLFSVAKHQAISDKTWHHKYRKIRTKSSLPYTTDERPDISDSVPDRSKDFSAIQTGCRALPMTNDGHKSRGKVDGDVKLASLIQVAM